MQKLADYIDRDNIVSLAKRAAPRDQRLQTLSEQREQALRAGNDDAIDKSVGQTSDYLVQTDQGNYSQEEATQNDRLVRQTAEHQQGIDQAKEDLKTIRGDNTTEALNRAMQYAPQGSVDRFNEEREGLEAQRAIAGKDPQDHRWGDVGRGQSGQGSQNQSGQSTQPQKPQKPTADVGGTEYIADDGTRYIRGGSEGTGAGWVQQDKPEDTGLTDEEREYQRSVREYIDKNWEAPKKIESEDGGDEEGTAEYTDPTNDFIRGRILEGGKFRGQGGEALQAGGDTQAARQRSFTDWWGQQPQRSDARTLPTRQTRQAVTEVPPPNGEVTSTIVDSQRANPDVSSPLTPPNSNARTAVNRAVNAGVNTMGNAIAPGLGNLASNSGMLNNMYDWGKNTWDDTSNLFNSMFDNNKQPGNSLLPKNPAIEDNFDYSPQGLE